MENTFPSIHLPLHHDNSTSPTHPSNGTSNLYTIYISVYHFINWIISIHQSIHISDNWPNLSTYPSIHLPHHHSLPHTSFNPSIYLPHHHPLTHTSFNPSIHLPHHHPLPHTSLNPSISKSNHPPSHPSTATPMCPPNITIKYKSRDKYTYTSIHL